MIRCSKCGTINRDNSRFCNECGAPLKPTKIRCSACGTLNAVGNVFCDKCNARLLSGKDMVPPMAAKSESGEAQAPSIKGISLPSRQTAADEEVPERAELPDWLLELTDESGGAPHTPEAPAAANLPNWLSGIAPEEVPTSATPGAVPTPVTRSESPPSVAPLELPDWLSELAEEEEASPVAPVQLEAATDLPDWLSEVAPPSVPVRTGETEAEALPDWLSGLETETESKGTEPEPELPDWLSEPTSPTVSSPISNKKAAADLPDWLSDLTPEEEAVPAETQPPDWLSGLTSEEETVEATPDWLSGLTPEAETTPTEAQPDWLSGIAVEEPTSAEESAGDWPGEGEEETVAPAMDWMSGLAGQTSLEEEVEAEEAQFAGWPMEEVSAVAPESYAPSAALPTWLSAIADEGPGYASGEPQELPQWLLKHADPGAMEFESAGPAPLPGWLMAHADEAASLQRTAPAARQAGTVQATQPPTRQPQQEAPADWASDLLTGAAEPESAEEPVDWATIGSTNEEEENLPDWLRGLEEKAPAAVLEEPTTAMPSWLSAEAEIKTEEEEEALPDWLSGAGEEISEAAQEPSFGTPESEAGLEEAELPDWLRGLDEEAPKRAPTAPGAAAAATREEELPDWLQGERPGEELPAGLGEPISEPAEAEELPDWLSGLETAPPERESRKEPAPTRTGVPDWLAAIPQESLTTTEPEEEEEEELSLEEEGVGPPAVAEIPDWLSNLTPTPAEGEGMGSPADENLARAQVPTWLQELRPSGTGPLPPLPEGTPVSIPDTELSAGEAEGLIRAEIPDWVQKLRPTVSADGELQPSAATMEEEGPLAGLSGIIFPKPGIDIPDDFQPQPPPQTPDAILQQAQLWQQLLEQPRGKAHAVSRAHIRPGWGIIAVRFFTVAVLFLAVLAGLLLSGDRLSQAPPDTARPGVMRMIKAIDTLEPDSTVILAVEYGPAEAPEMQIMVETLLEHLQERHVKLVAVSTLPEGAGIASSLLHTRAITNQLAEGESPYLPGTYNGIAKFLRDVEKQSPALLLVLSGRAERTRWWIEQNAVRVNATPLALGINATTGAVVRPYFDGEEVRGWVVGFADTMTYRTSRGSSTRPAGQLFEYGQVLDSLMLTHWAAICLIVFGFLYSLAAGKQEGKL
ncbi:MAG: zinc ribbon domain-containing protein [Anaerolineae bacterium]|nr:zinc ribbon domain-containing protein [Anaerolineae bacterium]